MYKYKLFNSIRHPVQTFKVWQRQRLETRANYIRLRIERIEMLHEIMRIYGAEGIRQGASYIVELLMEKMQSNRLRHTQLKAELKCIEKKLNT